jgi:hypothetical protein
MYGIIAYLFESENWYGSQLQMLQGFAVKQKQTLMEFCHEMRLPISFRVER